MYTIHVSHNANLVEVGFRGLLTPEEAIERVRAFADLIANKGLPVGYRLLIDVRNCEIQPQDTIRAIALQITSLPKASRIAVVTESPLARFQIRRVFTQPYARIVGTIEQGRAWTVSGIEPHDVLAIS